MKDRLPIRIAQVLFLLALTRHLAVAFFVHPFADDFSYAVAGMRSDLGQRLVQEYTSWNGRYFSNILLLRGPMTLGVEHGSWLYRSVAIGLIFFTWFAAYRFVRVLLPLAGRERSATMSLLFLLCFFYVMPNPSEGFYWYTGAMTYQLPNALSLFLMANWVRYLRAPGVARSWKWYAAQVLLVMVIAGCNEVHMAFLVLAHGGLLIHGRLRTRSFSGPVAVLFVLSVLCAIVVAAAPGNATRGAHFAQRHDIVLTVGHSVAQTARFGALVLIALPVLMLTIHVPSIRSEAAALGMIRPFSEPLNKWLALALPFLFLLVAMVVTYWPTGVLGQHRTVNMGLFYFLITWFFATMVWDQQVLQPRNIGAEGGMVHWSWSLVFVGAMFLFHRGGLGLTWELCDGTYTRYDRGMMARYVAIRASPPGELVLPAIEWPTSLQVLPLDTSPEHWMNRSLADFFGRNDLRLKEPGRSPEE